MVHTPPTPPAPGGETPDMVLPDLPGLRGPKVRRIDRFHIDVFDDETREFRRFHIDREQIRNQPTYVGL